VPYRFHIELELVPDGGAHWHHLVNTIESSVCGGSAFLCPITLTTCYYYYYYVDGMEVALSYTVKENARIFSLITARKGM